MFYLTLLPENIKAVFPDISYFGRYILKFVYYQFFNYFIEFLFQVDIFFIEDKNLNRNLIDFNQRIDISTELLAPLFIQKIEFLSIRLD